MRTRRSARVCREVVWFAGQAVLMALRLAAVAIALWAGAAMLDAWRHRFWLGVFASTVAAAMMFVAVHVINGISKTE